MVLAYRCPKQSYVDEVGYDNRQQSNRCTLILSKRLSVSILSGCWLSSREWDCTCFVLAGANALTIIDRSGNDLSKRGIMVFRFMSDGIYCRLIRSSRCIALQASSHAPFTFDHPGKHSMLSRPVARMTSHPCFGAAAVEPLRQPRRNTSPRELVGLGMCSEFRTLFDAIWAPRKFQHGQTHKRLQKVPIVVRQYDEWQPERT